MLEALVGHYAYWFTIVLLGIGLYGMIFKNNLVKKLIGMSIFQVAIILFYVASASKWNATVPVLEHSVQSEIPVQYINPLPHTLMLTAIVVGVATSGVAFALCIRLFRQFKTLDENILLTKMKDDTE